MIKDVVDKLALVTHDYSKDMELLRSTLKDKGIDFIVDDNSVFLRTQISHDGWYESIICGYGAHANKSYPYEYACCYNELGCMGEPEGYLNIEQVMEFIEKEQQ